MPSVIDEVVFSEPSGRPAALVQFGGSLAFVCVYAYASVSGNGGSSGWVLVMAAGSALAGVAESLPKNRRRTAGAFRLTAVLLLLCLLGAIVFVPEIVVR